MGLSGGRTQKPALAGKVSEGQHKFELTYSAHNIIKLSLKPSQRIETRIITIKKGGYMRIMHGKEVVVLLSMIVLLGAQACGGGSSTPTPATTTSFEGVMTNTTGTQSGEIEATIEGAVAKSLLFSIIRTAYASTTTTGTLTLVGGGTVDLTGTFDDPTLILSGGGYTFTGTVSGDDIAGTYTETDEADGGFVGFNSTTHTVVVYCGTWDRPADPAHGCDHARTGVWNLASSNGVISGIESDSENERVNSLAGTVSGNTISVTNSRGGEGTGTISGSTVSGTFVNWKGCPGTWTGTVGCQ